tara:strand:+ start:3311 stop:3595 length:285 start_codon:yes stop_codon:yes gene_type:complete
MSRKHTVSYPKSEIEPVLDDNGEIITPGYAIPSYQLDIPFTPDEELARDAEEVRSALRHQEAQMAETRLNELQNKLRDDTITFDELKAYMRITL